MNKHIIIAWENTNGQGVLLLSALHLLGWINRLSIECRKTKTKVITTVNQKEGKYRRSQWELLHLKTTTLPATKSRMVLHLIGWESFWREFSRPITNQNLSKTNAILNFFRHSNENYSKTKLTQDYVRHSIVGIKLTIFSCPFLSFSIVSSAVRFASSSTVLLFWTSESSRLSVVTYKITNQYSVFGKHNFVTNQR